MPRSTFRPAEASPRPPGARTGSAESPPLDRTTLNAWEDADFLAAVRAAGRRKLVLCALWTEMCIAFPALDALREGYDVYPVVDAIAGTSVEAHRAGRQPHRAGWRATHQRGAPDVGTAAGLATNTRRPAA